MHRIRSGLAWTLLTVMVGGLSVIATVEWRRFRREEAQAAGRLEQAVQQLEKRQDASCTAWGAELRSIRKGQEGLRAEIARLEAPRATPGSPPSDPEPSAEPEASPELAVAATEATPLPDVPEGINPEAFLAEGADIKSILADTRFNPGQKELSRAGKLKAQAELTRARAAMQVIDSDLRASIAEGMETLRAEGAYVEYAQGQPFDTVEGVLSAGEEMEHQGARLFFFYPEEFPQIYARSKDRGEAAEVALRRVLAMLAD